MSDALIDPQTAAEKARALLQAETDQKVEAVRTLANAANDADNAEARAKEAVSVHETAWKAALSAGWTEKDLRATGVRAPGQAGRRARPRAPKDTTPTTEG